MLPPGLDGPIPPREGARAAISLREQVLARLADMHLETQAALRQHQGRLDRLETSVRQAVGFSAQRLAEGVDSGVHETLTALQAAQDVLLARADGLDQKLTQLCSEVSRLSALLARPECRTPAGTMLVHDDGSFLEKRPAAPPVVDLRGLWTQSQTLFLDSSTHHK